MFPQADTLGQIIGQFYAAMFKELTVVLSTERAEIQAYLLTKALIHSVVTTQQHKILTRDSLLTKVLTQFQPKGSA